MSTIFLDLNGVILQVPSSIFIKGQVKVPAYLFNLIASNHPSKTDYTHITYTHDPPHEEILLDTASNVDLTENKIIKPSRLHVLNTSQIVIRLKNKKILLRKEQGKKYYKRPILHYQYTTLYNGEALIKLTPNEIVESPEMKFKNYTKISGWQHFIVEETPFDSSTIKKTDAETIKNEETTAHQWYEIFKELFKEKFKNIELIIIQNAAIKIYYKSSFLPQTLYLIAHQSTEKPSKAIQASAILADRYGVFVVNDRLDKIAREIINTESTLCPRKEYYKQYLTETVAQKVRKIEYYPLERDHTLLYYFPHNYCLSINTFSNDFVFYHKDREILNGTANMGNVAYALLLSIIEKEKWTALFLM